MIIDKDRQLHHNSTNYYYRNKISIHELTVKINKCKLKIKYYNICHYLNIHHVQLQTQVAYFHTHCRVLVLIIRGLTFMIIVKITKNIFTSSGCVDGLFRLSFQT